jgi:hypothetical protein
MLAMVVNDDAGSLKARGVLAFLASVRASTGCSLYVALVPSKRG